MANNGYFCFRFSVSLTRGFVDEVLVVFHSIGAELEGGIGAAIYDAIQDGSPPDHVLVVMDVFELAKIKNLIDKTRLIDGLNRVGTRQPVLLAGYDVCGEIVEVLTYRCKTTLALALANEFRANFKASGLSEITQRGGGDVLLRAPHGFMFSKPSSRASNYFIRTENAFVGIEELNFMAFCLLKDAAAWELRFGGDIRYVFIDSMTISSLVISLFSIREKFGKEFPQIASFGGYQGLKSLEFRAPPPNTAWALISASSNWSLAETWCQRTKSTPASTLVLASFEDSSFERPVWHKIARPRDWEQTDDSELEERGVGRVQLVGERFLSQPAVPRSVDIALKHAPEEVADRLKGLVGESIFDCNRRSRIGDLPKELYADGECLLKAQKFRDWCDSQLQLIPKGFVGHIVHQADLPSFNLATYCQKAIARRGQSAPKILSESDLETRTAPIEGGVLILAVVVGSGNCLLNISRNLRPLHRNGFRQYLIGLALPRSEASYAEVKRNLTLAPATSRYHVANFEMFPVGANRYPNPWQRELATIGKQRTPYGTFRFSTRVKGLSATGSGLKNDVFWHSPNGTPLELRPGFAFWRGKCSSSALCDLVATMRIVLQHARTSDSLEYKDRLGGSALQQVVISPECFSRFDDGAIQSAILRSAHDHELDYSHHAELSARMLKVLQHVFGGLHNSRGEASAEFLVALISGRLKISDRDLTLLKSYMRQKKLAATTTQVFRNLTKTFLRRPR